MDVVDLLIEADPGLGEGGQGVLYRGEEGGHLEEEEEISVRQEVMEEEVCSEDEGGVEFHQVEEDLLELGRLEVSDHQDLEHHLGEHLDQEDHQEEEWEDLQDQHHHSNSH